MASVLSGDLGFESPQRIKLSKRKLDEHNDEQDEKALVMCLDCHLVQTFTKADISFMTDG